MIFDATRFLAWMLPSNLRSLPITQALIGEFAGFVLDARGLLTLIWNASIVTDIYATLFFNWWNSILTAASLSKNRGRFDPFIANERQKIRDEMAMEEKA